MPLEGGDGFISGLVVTNPVNATDQVAQGDDHLRLIKTALKGSFPSVSGAVTATHTELNALDGITSSVAELNILDGVTLTAAQINDVARVSFANVFTAAQTISAATPEFLFTETGASANNKHWSFVTQSERFRGLAYSDLFSGNNWLVVDRTGNTIDQVALSATTLSLSGDLSTPGASAAEVGYKGTPQNVQNGDYGIVLADCGKTIYKASGGAGETITIPANGTIAIPVGTIIRVVNNGGGTLSIAITSDTLTLAGAGTTGTRTLSDNGVAVLEKVASTEWFISGIGVS